MTVPFTLPSQKPQDDARARLERLYRDVGICAVASALYAQHLPSPEEREKAALSSHDLPAFLREDDIAA